MRLQPNGGSRCELVMMVGKGQIIRRRGIIRSGHPPLPEPTDATWECRLGPHQHYNVIYIDDGSSEHYDWHRVCIRLADDKT